jgi:PTH1 family peptidyl-tRNA hydrolase
MIELIVFLGNPGLECLHNRHNAGRLLAERLPFYERLGWQKKFKGLYAALEKDRVLPGPAGEGPELPPRYHFLMPETYMNLSGESIRAAAAFFKIQAPSILLVHDELELPPGTISLKFSGGLGGHNGLRSMKAAFGTADFWRLRIGIGRPGDRPPGKGGPPQGGAKNGGPDIAGWVLSDFSAPEEEILNHTLAAAAELLVLALAGAPESLLPEWGKKKAAAGEDCGRQAGQKYLLSDIQPLGPFSV